MTFWPITYPTTQSYKIEADRNTCQERFFKNRHFPEARYETLFEFNFSSPLVSAKECMNGGNILVFNGTEFEIYNLEKNSWLISMEVSQEEDNVLYLKRNIPSITFCTTSPYDWDLAGRGLKMGCYRYNDSTAVAVPMDTVLMSPIAVRGCRGWVDGSVMGVKKYGATTTCSSVNTPLSGFYTVGTVFYEKCLNDTTFKEAAYECTSDGLIRTIERRICSPVTTYCRAYIYSGISTDDDKRTYVDVSPSVVNSEDVIVSSLNFYSDKRTNDAAFTGLLCGPVKRVRDYSMSLYSIGSGRHVSTDTLTSMYAAQ